MNKNLDEVYITLLKAKEKIYEYTKNKVKNENWRPYYNGIVENIDNIIVDYSIATNKSIKICFIFVFIFSFEPFNSTLFFNKLKTKVTIIRNPAVP